MKFLRIPVLAAAVLSSAGACGTDPGPASEQDGLPEKIRCVDVRDGRTFEEPPAYFNHATNLVYDPAAGRYGLGDLWTPAERPGPHPAILHVHGGGWTGGHKSLRNARLWGEFFACRGVAFFDIDYELAPEAPMDVQAQEAKCALRWLKGNADTLNLDPERIGVMGGSAGGHLTGLIATTPEIDAFAPTCTTHTDQDVRVAVAIPVYGIFNFLTMQEERIDLDDSAERWMGVTHPTEADWLRVSPISYVTDDDPPFLFLQGKGDVLVPWQQSVEMAAALAKVGVPSETVLLENGEHGFDAFFNSEEMVNQVLPAAEAFIQQYLLGEGS